MSRQEIQIGLSSVLVRLFQQQGRHHELQELGGRVYTVMQSLNQALDSGMSKSEVLKMLYKLADEKINEKIEEQDKLTPSCKKGCAFCCKMNLDVSPAEADLLIEHAKINNILIDENYLLQQVSVPKDEIALRPSTRNCVFLDTTPGEKYNTCKVYDVRPMACRKYLVATPAHECNVDVYPKGEVAAIINVDVEIMVSALDSVQGSRIDSLPKMLLQQLDKQKRKTQTKPVL